MAVFLKWPSIMCLEIQAVNACLLCLQMWDSNVMNPSWELTHSQLKADQLCESIRGSRLFLSYYSNKAHRYPWTWRYTQDGFYRKVQFPWAWAGWWLFMGMVTKGFNLALCLSVAKIQIVYCQQLFNKWLLSFLYALSFIKFTKQWLYDRVRFHFRAFNMLYMVRFRLCSKFKMVYVRGRQCVNANPFVSQWVQYHCFSMPCH